MIFCNQIHCLLYSLDNFVFVFFDKIKSKDHNANNVKKKIYERLEQKYKNKEISEKLYKGFNDEIKVLGK